MLVRLAMRLSIGVPDQLGPKSDWRARVARAAHLSFYVWHFFIVRDGAMERMLTLRGARASTASVLRCRSLRNVSLERPD